MIRAVHTPHPVSRTFLVCFACSLSRASALIVSFGVYAVCVYGAFHPCVHNRATGDEMLYGLFILLDATVVFHRLSGANKGCVGIGFQVDVTLEE